MAFVLSGPVPGKCNQWSIVISRPARRVAQAGVLTLVVAGGAVVAAQLDKSVNLSVDGKTSAVHVFGAGTTVADVLAKQDIKVGPHDVVAPGLSAQVSDGSDVVVRYGRLLSVTVDGKTKQYWTTATTVETALAELGIRADKARLSVSRSTVLGRTGLSMSLSTPKAVTVVADGKTTTKDSTLTTVGEVLAERGIKVDSDDRVSPATTTPVTTAGMKITVKRVTQKSVNKTESIAYSTTKKKDSSMYKGQTKVLESGDAGAKKVTYKEVWVDGKLESRKATASKVTEQPEARVVAYGTKSRPASSSSYSSGGSAPSGSIDYAMWDRIAWCESGQRWHLNLGSGYYGGLQFNMDAWRIAGGFKYAPRPDLASREQQIWAAENLRRQMGLRPWTCRTAA